MKFPSRLGRNATLETHSRRSNKGVLIVFAAMLAVMTHSASAIPVVAYEWSEGGPGNGSNSLFNSFHSAAGPVLADDFTTAIGGQVVRVDWWGSEGIAGAPNTWEITFHDDMPAATPSFPFISQHFVNAGGSDLDGDGVFFFSAAWNPADTLLNAATSYWFSVANSNTNNWLWANPGGAAPTVGNEQFDALQSIGGAPSTVAGPHDGPWSITTGDQNFAFRIWVESEVSEPNVLMLVALGAIICFGMSGRRPEDGRRAPQR